MSTMVNEIPKRKPKRRTRRRFTEEFKAQTVRLIRAKGKSIASVARDLDLVPSVVSMWLTRAAVKEFRKHVAAEFAFLINEFGCHEDHVPLKNEFSVTYVNATTRILIEGINWGGSARVAFGSAGPLEAFEDFDLLDLASIRCPDRIPPESPRPATQLSHLRTLAALCRDCGAEVLRGDFRIAPTIRERREQRLQEWEQEEARRGRPRPPRPADPWPLHTAAERGDAGRARQLLSAGADVNAFDSLHRTPLHYAARGEHLDLVQLLLGSGARVDAHHAPTIGNTPLGDVAATCSLAMARLLVEAGADPTIPGWMQLTALDKAAGRQRGDGPKVYELLLQSVRRKA